MMTWQWKRRSVLHGSALKLQHWWSTFSQSHTQGSRGLLSKPRLSPRYTVFLLSGTQNHRHEWQKYALRFYALVIWNKKDLMSCVCRNNNNTLIPVLASISKWTNLACRLFIDLLVFSIVVRVVVDLRNVGCNNNKTVCLRCSFGDWKSREFELLFRHLTLL